MTSCPDFLCVLSTAVASSDNECSDYSAVVQIPKITELEWLLSLREEENEIVRTEFYYEQVSVCSKRGKWTSDMAHERASKEKLAAGQKRRIGNQWGEKIEKKLRNGTQEHQGGRKDPDDIPGLWGNSSVILHK